MHIDMFNKIGKATFYEYDLGLPIVIVDDKKEIETIEFGIAVFTPAESDDGASHVIEHCIASELTRTVGNTMVSAYVLHNITFYNFKICQDDLDKIKEILCILFDPEFLRNKSIYSRESFNVQEKNGVRRCGGVVLNEMLMKSREPMYVLLSNIPRSLSKNSRTTGIAGGTISGILNLTYEKCKYFYRKYYKLANSCVSIHGNFSDDQLNQIFTVLLECKISCADENAKPFLSECKRGNIIEKYMVYYAADNTDNVKKFVYSINLKLLSPKSMMEYEYYLWIKNKLNAYLKVRGCPAKLVFRNLIDYAYISIIPQNSSYEKHTLEIVSNFIRTLSVNDYWKIHESYIWNTLEDNKGHIRNEKILSLISEAFFGNLPALTFLKTVYNAGIIYKHRAKEVLESIRINEVIAHSQSIKEYDKVLEDYLNTKDVVKYVAGNIDINWKQFKVTKRKQKGTSVPKYIHKWKSNNIDIYQYRTEKEYDCVKFFFNISEVSVENAKLFTILAYFLNIEKTNCKYNVQLKVLPLYDYLNKKTDSFLVIQLMYSKGSIEKPLDNLEDLLTTMVKRKGLSQYLNAMRQEASSKFEESKSCFLLIRLLAKFRIGDYHKDVNFGIGKSLFIRDLIDDPALRQKLYDFSLDKILENKLVAISLYCNSRVKIDGYVKGMANNTVNQGTGRLTIPYGNNEVILVQKGLPCLVMGLDISGIDSNILLKFRILCKMITKIYLLPKIRERGIYHGEISLIEDVLVLCIENPPYPKIGDELMEQIRTFIGNNMEEIVAYFPDAFQYYLSRQRNNFDAWDEREVIYDLCNGSYEYGEKLKTNDQIEVCDLELFSSIVMQFSKKSKKCLSCNRKYIEVNKIAEKIDKLVLY